MSHHPLPVRFVSLPSPVAPLGPSRCARLAHSPIRRRARRGLTLIEVMLAVTILSVGMVVLLAGAQQCLVVIKVARNYQKAQWVLQVGELEHPMTGAMEIEDMAVDAVEYDGFEFKREVDEDEDEDGLYLIRTTVRWGDDSSRGLEEVMRYIFEPDKDEE